MGSDFHEPTVIKWLISWNDSSRNLHARLVLLRPHYPRGLRLAPLLPRVSVHEESRQGAEGGARALADAGRHDPAAALQRDVRRRSADRSGLPNRIPRASGSRFRCSTTRPTRRAASPSWRSAASPRRASTSSTFHRTDRTGYKAGALEAGLKVARGEFIAIFDADFIPTADFLTRLMPHFRRRGRRHGAGALGPHQPRTTRCSRRSRRFCSTATSCSSTAPATAAGRFFNFNGTGGHLAAQAIDDAGGWQHDTLTEDLDLSYRAQLRAGGSCSCPTWSRRPKCRSR